MDNPKKHAADHDAKGAKPKRPKHFHAGPNPIAEEEEKQPAVADTASPISRLYPDTLGAVFNFLDLPDFHRLLAVSRSWSALVSTGLPCAGFFSNCTTELLMTMSSSALARHITVIRDWRDNKFALPSDSLFILTSAMPRLLALQCEILPSSAQKMVLPPRLTYVDLNLSKLDVPAISVALEAIGQLSALKQLRLEFPSWLPEINFAPLSKCPVLAMLTIMAIKWSTEPTDAHIDQLRALTHLRRVAIPRLTSSSLARLLRAPHSLQWTEMYDVASFDSTSAAALRNLPSLLSLQTSLCRDVSFLAVMTQIQTLALLIAPDPWAVTEDAVVEVLSGCRQLTVLCLVAPVTSKHFAQLFPHLPLLHTLALVHCSELESLAFLSDVASLQTSLRLFQLDWCRHPALRSAEMAHVLKLKELTKLELKRSFADPLDGLTQLLLTPPSSLLPKLTSFQYESPAAAAP